MTTTTKPVRRDGRCALRARGRTQTTGSPSKRGYKIYWDNNTEACGTFPQLYSNKREAEADARRWKRDMVALETTDAGRREARRLYQWEIIEAELMSDSDPESFTFGI